MPPTIWTLPVAMLKVAAGSFAPATFTYSAEVTVALEVSRVTSAHPAGAVSAYVPSRLATCATITSPACVAAGGVSVRLFSPAADVWPRAAIPGPGAQVRPTPRPVGGATVPAVT